MFCTRFYFPFFSFFFTQLEWTCFNFGCKCWEPRNLRTFSIFPYKYRSFPVSLNYSWVSAHALLLSHKCSNSSSVPPHQKFVLFRQMFIFSRCTWPASKRFFIIFGVVFSCSCCAYTSFGMLNQSLLCLQQSATCSFLSPRNLTPQSLYCQLFILPVTLAIFVHLYCTEIHSMTGKERMAKMIYFFSLQLGFVIHLFLWW